MYEPTKSYLVDYQSEPQNCKCPRITRSPTNIIIRKRSQSLFMVKNTQKVWDSKAAIPNLCRYVHICLVQCNQTLKGNS